MLYIINLFFKLNISKEQLSSTVENFCFQNQLQIMAALCSIYVGFFCCICEPVTAVIVIFWFGFLFTLVYFLNTLKVPVLNTVLIVAFVVRTIFIAQKENIVPSVVFFLFVFVFLGVLYFSFENNSLMLRIKTFFQSLKKDRLIFENCVKTKFEYLEGFVNSSFLYFCSFNFIKLYFKCEYLFFLRKFKSRATRIIFDTFIKLFIPCSR